jgi:hypothetical protein
MKKYSKFISLIGCLIFITSCGKGYQVRFANYANEHIDSLVVGNSFVVFLNVAKNSTTEFNKLKKGKHTIKCITKSKKRLSSTITIPRGGKGNRTIQIDGLNLITVLEE